MVVHMFNPSTWEAEAARSLYIRGQSGLHSKFQVIQGYIALQWEPVSKKKKKKKEKEKKIRRVSWLVQKNTVQA